MEDVPRRKHQSQVEVTFWPVGTAIRGRSKTAIAEPAG